VTGGDDIDIVERDNGGSSGGERGISGIFAEDI